MYPVIEGSKDDQPELDFSRDEPEAQIEAPPLRVRKSRPKGKGAELLSQKPRRRQILQPNRD